MSEAGWGINNELLEQYRRHLRLKIRAETAVLRGAESACWLYL